MFFVQYFTGLSLELSHDGQKWWDYSGYFLNLHGRICAEGLLVFGLGGMAIVYFVAPLLDNWLRRISLKVLVPVCVVLLAIYCVDQVYSSKHPNMGEGITDYGQTEVSQAGKDVSQSVQADGAGIGLFSTGGLVDVA